MYVQIYKYNMLSLHFCLCVYGNNNVLIKFINLQAVQNKSLMFGGGVGIKMIARVIILQV